MNRTLWIAASGMDAQQLRTDTIANNIANVDTTSYKRGVCAFQDMLYQRMSTPGSATAAATDIPAGIQIGTGVTTGSVSKYFGQGDLVDSSSPLSLAINGSGFFQVLMPDGTTAYTRAGNLHMNQSGMVVTTQGYQIIGFPTLDTTASSTTIAEDGTVSQYVNSTNVTKGRIQVARFANPEGLTYLGNNLYGQTESSGSSQVGSPTSQGYGAIEQNKLEGSNVDMVQEMVDLISAQRAYELNSKCIKTADQNMQMIANLKN